MIIVKVDTTLWQIDIGYAVFGVETDASGKIIKTAPIGKWMLGKNIYNF